MSTARPSILIVDDVPENLAVLSNSLSDHYRVRAATSGARALSICRSEDPPAIVLLDVIMPEMDGYEVCRQLKADPRTAQIPVFFVSGNAGLEEEERCLALGGVDCLNKPIRVALLMRRLEQQIELLTARRRIAELTGA